MASLKIGKVYKFKQTQRTKYLVVITDGVEWVNGRLSNVWSGNIIKDDGSIGERIVMSYRDDSDFEEVKDVQMKFSGPGVDLFFEKVN